ncbi:MAG: PriCT-2 domain-containing protein [Saprospiraceae bacterium]|nr:PriCT-2 domain-containing protein [Saprospiraceae bacterium]
MSSPREFVGLVETCISKIEESRVNITSSYDNWIRIGFSLVNTFGERGRGFFQRISSFYPAYDVAECEQKYSDLLESALKSDAERPLTIATFFELCREMGVEVAPNDTKVSGKFQTVSLFLADRTIRFNEFNRKTEVRGEEIEDRDVNSFYVDLQELGVSVSRDYISTLIHSNRTQSYHPLREFMRECSALSFSNEIDQLTEALIFKDAESENIRFLKSLIEKWLLQIPAVIFDEVVPRLVLVLIGPSHIGKTHFFRNLLPAKLSQYYAESSLNQGKDSFILMAEKLIINNDEFGGIMRMNEMEQFKRMASAENFDERRAYGRYNERFRRRAILCGTSNRIEVISDQTAANTRIIPVEISSISHDLFNGIDKSKLLANVLVRYHQLGEDATRLSYAESDSLQDYSKGFQTVNFEQEAILAMYEPGNRFFTSGQLAEAIKNVYGANVNARKLSEEFRRLEFPSTRRRIGDQHVRGWLVNPRPQNAVDF